MRFVHDNLPQRICFGSGEAAGHLKSEMENLGARRAMVIASDRAAEVARTLTDDLPVAVYHDEVVMHVPVEVADRARAAAAKADADVLISVGGGSATGLAKAIAMTTGLPVIAVPTTYAGSEATPVWGLTEGAKKTTGTDPKVLPRTVVYDAALTLSLPVEMSVASGLNALAHCVDALWAPKADPINAAFAAEGIRALNTGLKKVAANPLDLAGREETLYASYVAAVSFASAGSALHHKICHVLGGKYNLPHAQTHATVLPYVLAFNGPAAPDAWERIGGAFGLNDALDGLQRLRTALGAPRALADYGFAEGDVPAAAAAILPAVPPSNPRPVTAADLEALLHAARTGADPNAMGLSGFARRTMALRASPAAPLRPLFGGAEGGGVTPPPFFARSASRRFPSTGAGVTQAAFLGGCASHRRPSGSRAVGRRPPRPSPGKPGISVRSRRYGFVPDASKILKGSLPFRAGSRASSSTTPPGGESSCAPRAGSCSRP